MKRYRNYLKRDGIKLSLNETNKVVNILIDEINKMNSRLEKLEENLASDKTYVMGHSHETGW